LASKLPVGTWNPVTVTDDVAEPESSSVSPSKSARLRGGSLAF
jgi:hypothetical protein